MKSGIYLIDGHERRQIATIDDMIYGDEVVQQEIALDLLSLLRDATVDMISDDNDDGDIRKIAIVIIQ